MKFTVKTLDGKSQEFDLSGELTVAQLKEKVEDAMGLPADRQRMLLAGKVMANDQTIQSYGVEGKIVHVVKNAPSVQKSAPPPQVPASMQPEKRSNEYMYIGVTPETLPPPSDVLYLQDVAKDSADNILGNVNGGGHPHALVTVTVHTLTPDGRTVHSSTHTSTSYKPGNSCMVETPDPAVAEEELRKRKEREEQRQARRARLARYREKVKEQQRTGREQTNILEIYQHMTSVRRAIQGAENILEEYLNSNDYKEAKEVLEHHLKLKAEAEKEAEKEAAKDSQVKEDEESTSQEDGAKKPARKEDGPQYAMGEDGRPRQHILTDTGMLLPAGAHLYAALLDDIMVLQRRGLELHEFYAKKIYAEEHYEYEDYRCNAKLVTAVHRYHNAMGQAYNSVKRVQVTLEGEPPRIVSLIPSARPTNPLLSLLSQPLGGDSDNEETSGGQQGDEDGGQSIAGLLGSLMATRAAMRMMEDDEQQQERRNQAPAVTTGPSDSSTSNNDTPSGGGEGAAGGQEQQPKEDKKEEEEDEINPFLPGPVHLLQQMMRQRQERERQQQQERTVVIQPDQPFYETIARIRQAVGGPEEEIMPPTLIGNLVERCMRKMSISEVVTVFGGTTAPLVTIHPTLRDFIRERLLNGEEPTNDNIPQAIDSFVEGLPAVLNGLDPPLPLREDVDFGASAKKCCAFKLKEVMDLIVNKPDDDPEFPQRLYDWAMNIGTFFTLLLRECLLSSNDLTPSLKRISKMMFPDNDTPGVLSMLNSQSLVDKFVDESEKSTIPLEEVTCHIVSVGEQQPMEVEPTASKDAEQDQAQMSDQPPPSHSDAYLSSVPAKKRKQLEGGEAEDTTEEQ